ncbi:MAG: L,D-transpeptidase family protein [Sulfuricurvum sp.]|nr:L,D-transpeptidase family protein [Sulfuricurvum sp.]
MSPFKPITFFILLSPFLFGSQQLVVVISTDINATSAMMTRYEKDSDVYRAVSASVPVVLGRSGLGWDQGYEPLKREGDGRSPAGIFDISATFGEAPNANSALTYWYADDKLICIDDVNDTRYNTMGRLDPANPPKSFEQMRRNDMVYRNGAVIDYNSKRISGRGSCIFFHLNHPNKRPTAGCTAMDEQPLLELIHWLDPNKKPKLLQIPKSACEEYQKEFVGIMCE